MTASVVAGQIHVALSYKIMSKFLQDFLMFQILRDKNTTLLIK